MSSCIYMCIILLILDVQFQFYDSVNYSSPFSDRIVIIS